MENENLLRRLKELEKESAALEINKENRTQLSHQVEDYTSDFIEALPELPAYSAKQANESKFEINKDTISIEEILRIYTEEVNETGLKPASGGHIGYIPGGGIYAGALGDFIAAISNVYAGVSYASPGAVGIENAVLNWLKQIFSFPLSAAGNLTSGGSMANLIALTAARDKYGIKNEQITKSVVYMSPQVHHCVSKDLRIIGLEDVVVRHPDLDQDFKIVPASLNKMIEEDKKSGLRPFLVIASAGTTDVGAVDPLKPIGEIAHKHQLWFHVDAAYGGFFILTSKKNLFEGIELADSLVVDPHKGMFIPYGVGAVLVKDVKAVLHSQRYSANYMQDAEIEDLAKDPANVSPELTKHFRGLRVWLPLKLHGIKPFIACLEEKLLLTQYFREELVKRGFEVGPEPDLSVSYFWYPFKEQANEKNRLLMDEIHRDGSVFLSSTLIKEKFVIRMAILSFRTKKDTIDKALMMIENCLKKVETAYQN